MLGKIEHTHSSTVQYRPQATPDTEGGSVGNRETNVVHGTETSIDRNKDTSDAVSDPDTEPGLPP